MSIFSKIGAAIGKAVGGSIGDVAKIGIGLLTGNPIAVAKGVKDLGKDVIKSITSNSNQVKLGVFNGTASSPVVVNGNQIAISNSTAGIGVWNTLDGTGGKNQLMPPAAVKQAQDNPMGKPQGQPKSDNSAALIGGGLLALLAL